MPTQNETPEQATPFGFDENTLDDDLLEEIDRMKDELNGVKRATTKQEANEFLVAFSNVQEEAHFIATEHGWWEDEREDGTLMMLIVSEVAEAFETMRKDPTTRDEHCPDYLNVEVELADVIIRIMDFAQYKGLDVASALLAKMDYNKTRPYKHGKRF